MQLEFQAKKQNIKIVAVNSIDAKSATDQKSLTDKCSFPLFQDVEKMKAWLRHSGGKDDFYIYDSKGNLAKHLPFGGSINTDLSQKDGYDAVKKEILKVK